MANNKKNSFFEYGWVVDPSHPIEPKPTKGFWIDLAFGLGVTAIGIIYTAISAFGHGAHGYERSHFDILAETGHLNLRDDGLVEESFDWDPSSEID